MDFRYQPPKFSERLVFKVLAAGPANGGPYFTKNGSLSQCLGVFISFRDSEQEFCPPF